MNPSKFLTASLSTTSLYQQYPCPSPIVADKLINDLAETAKTLFPNNSLDGWSILDVGCGAGNRTLALAEYYPKAKVTGIDVAETALEMGRGMAQKLGHTNVTFKQADVLELKDSEKYDLIVSSGIVYHLADPARGLKNLCDSLSDTGIILVWFHHPYGEMCHLLERELVFLLWRENRGDYREGVTILNELKSSNMCTHEPRTIHSALSDLISESDDISELSTNLEACLHPVVNTFSFDEAMQMFKSANLQWATVNNIRAHDNNKLIDLSQLSDPDSCLWEKDLFRTENLLQKYRTLNNAGKLRAIELILKPARYSIVAGKKDSFQKCDKRIIHNKVNL